MPEPAQVDEPVRIDASDPMWPALFAQEAERLRGVVGRDASIEHIGSTAVERLAAKPVIDVMLGVDGTERIEEIVGQVLSLGYEDCGGATGRRYLRSRTARHFNVQIVERGGELWNANLLLRDYLRARPDATRRYEDAKREAFAEAPMLLAYSETKRPIIEQLLEEARVWRDPESGG